MCQAQNELQTAYDARKKEKKLMKNRAEKARFKAKQDATQLPPPQ
jgi:hypothetical protein